jgi:hypothetical protein
MTENWQPRPSPWLAGGERPEEAADSTGPEGLSPVRLHVNGDVVSLGPPLVDPPKLSPAGVPTPTPPFLDDSYGQSSYSASPYVEPAPQTYGSSSQLTPVPHPSHQRHPGAPVSPPVVGVGGDDGMATMMVAVGTVQPRAPQPPATVEDAERVLGAAVDSLDADPDMYSIGTITDGAVCLIPDAGRWAVFLADGGQRRFAGSFDDPMMAAVHFAGVLLLAATERGAMPKPSAAEQAALPGQSVDPLAQLLAGPPIVPLAGDPPTTLYTDHRLTVLTPGTEVDRFGDQLGNTVYAARTRYPHRSLPPDYVEREYRVYRVRDPLRALAGTAIPWFGQPGGGTAYLLPRPIADLLREGALVEIREATVAPA